MPAVKVLVCGSRKWLNQQAIERELRKFPPGILVHGAARGADNIAGYVGKLLGWDVRPYPAHWDAYGRAAGPIRNQEMLDKEHPDSDGLFIEHVLAFHREPGLGIGTKDMVERASKAVPAIRINVFAR